mmetsp:Transcript_955/g.2061  ORF Transcript_955/g.2061 Transcript_955/m.2061 type:complete len:606 (+) Transcript_955:84-1901(+)
MYIRNSRGQLVWVPSQESVQAVQQNMRHQMQRDEWMRFNAPPVDDNLCFHDQYSAYEGSLSHGYHNVVHQCHSPAMNNNRNLVYQGLQPSNQMTPPIPRVINSTPAISGPLQNSVPIPEAIHSIPALSGQRQTAGNNMTTQIPRVNLPNESLPNPRTNIGAEMTTTAPRVVHSMSAMQGMHQNNGVNVMAQTHQGIHSTLTVHGSREAIRGDVISLKSKNPEVFNSVYHHSQDNIEIIEEEDHYDPSQHKVHLVEEEFIPEVNTSCLGAIFGSSFGLYDFKPRSRNTNVIDCNALNNSTSDDEDDGNYLPSSFTHSQQNEGSEERDGVRGQSKQVDYAGEQKTVVVSTENTSEGKPILNSNNTSQMYTIVPNGPKEKVEDTVVSKASEKETELSSLTSCERENVASCSSMNALADKTFEEDSSAAGQVNTIDSDVPKNLERENEVNNKLPSNLTEDGSKFDDPFRKHSQADSQNNQTNTQQVNKNIGDKISDAREHSKLGSIATNINKQRDTIVVENFIVEEDYPSFDEPAKPKNDGVNNVDQSTRSCSSTGSVSDGENTQKNANVLSTVERIPVSKRYMLKSREKAHRRRSLTSPNTDAKTPVV